MKNLFLCLLLLGLGGTALAQKSDVLHKLDRTTVNVRIDEIGDTDVYYFETASPGTKKMLPKSQLWKVVFADGSEEVFNAPRTPAAPPAATTRPATPPPPAAPTGRADRILTKDNRTIEAVVVGTGSGQVQYRVSSDPAGKVYSLPADQVARVEYADGRVVPGGALAATAAAPDASPTRPQGTPVVVNSGLSTGRSRPDYYRLHFTLGAEGAYFPDQLNARWNDDSLGLGMNQTIGFNARLDYRIVRPLAVSITGGYWTWELVRSYTLNGEEQYQETRQMTRIPLQLGLKLYVFRGLYLMPEGGIVLTRTRVSTSETHPEPTSTSASLTPLTYGGSIGCEIGAGPALIDISARYQILDVKDLSLSAQQGAFSERAQSVGIRIGIGFRALRKD